ncbi:hypothetical protein BGX26_002621, partial [Mortierella sp. AD094]
KEGPGKADWIMEEALSVPEICGHISLFLTQSDIAKRLRVNKGFHGLFIAAFWHTTTLHGGGDKFSRPRYLRSHANMI